MLKQLGKSYTCLTRCVRRSCRDVYVSSICRLLGTQSSAAEAPVSGAGSKAATAAAFKSESVSTAALCFYHPVYAAQLRLIRCVK